MKKISTLAAVLMAEALFFGFTGCSNGTSAPAVTYTVTVADGITNGTVTASKTSGIAAGEIITLTIAPEESESYDCALATLSVKNGDSDVAVSGTGNSRTFTMPAANVTVGATFTKTTYIGSKKPSVAKAVGDIVFNDGSAMPYTEFAALDNEAKNAKKTSAIALIFYKGTGSNDPLGAKTLGVGLKHIKKAWCTDSAKAKDKKIDKIVCTPNGNAGNLIFGESADKDGSDNLSQIAENLGNDDDTTGENAATLYPAFYFAINYKDTATNLGTEYADEWYLPTLAELFQIYANGKKNGAPFDIDIASDALGGSKFETSGYWSSSQYASSNNCAYRLDFSNGAGYGDGQYKIFNGYYVCAIRAFN